MKALLYYFLGIIMPYRNIFASLFFILSLTHGPLIHSMQQSQDQQLAHAVEAYKKLPPEAQHVTRLLLNGLTTLPQPEAELIQHKLQNACANQPLAPEDQINLKFFYACQQGLAKEVSTLLARGADVNYSSTKTHAATPLHIAAQNGQLNIVKILIKNGANPHAVNGQNMTALHFAAKKEHYYVTEFLIENKADLESRNDNEATPLHLASEENKTGAIVDLLCRKGANVHATTNKGWTPLHLACSSGNNKIIELLLDNGADLEATNISKNTPLMFACIKGHLETVKFLYKKKVNIHVLCEGISPLSAACMSNHLPVVQYLINNGANVGVEAGGLKATALYCACLSRNAQLITLLAANSDVNAITDTGETPLHCACADGDLDAVKILLSYGAKLDILLHNKFSCIDIAQDNGHDHIVDFIKQYNGPEENFTQDVIKKTKKQPSHTTNQPPTSSLQQSSKKNNTQTTQNNPPKTKNLPSKTNNKNESTCIADHKQSLGGYDNKIMLFKNYDNDLQPGTTYYQTEDKTGKQCLKPIEKKLDTIGSQLPENHVSELFYSKHVETKMQKSSDSFHSFTTRVEKNFGHWACTKVKDCTNRFSQKTYWQEQFNLTQEDVSDYWYELSVAIPARIGSSGCPDEILEKRGPSGNFNLIVLKKNLSDNNGLCVHRFFEKISQ